jgi:hypothetical protein
VEPDPHPTSSHRRAKKIYKRSFENRGAQIDGITNCAATALTHSIISSVVSLIFVARHVVTVTTKSTIIVQHVAMIRLGPGKVNGNSNIGSGQP